jgi:hypothetical protein
VASSLKELQILSVHPVIPSVQEFDEAVAIQWGLSLVGNELERARASVREHFNRLFLIEIQIQPADAELDWSKITQPIDGLDRSSWQVPYDERPIDQPTGRWAFFLHFVDLKRPVSTPLGERMFCPPTPIPPHLTSVKYEVPG